MKKYFLILFLALINGVYSQTITPSVINSGGKTSNIFINGNPAIYTDNIGEAVIVTGTNSTHVLTQGFLQPNTLVIKGVSVTPLPTNVSCADRRDGRIIMEVKGFPTGSTYTVQNTWTPSGPCTDPACSTRDSLSAGTFTIKTIYGYTLGGISYTFAPVISTATITDVNGICEIKVYTGITINGENSKFTIDNIELYPKARVTIFNRWGRKMFGEDHYSNIDNFWPAKGEKIMPGTYFYIIELDGKTNKGWVEVFEQ